MMTDQLFTAILKDCDTLDENWAERLYDRCDDVTAGSRDGVAHVHFDRPAESLNAAILSAIADLRACGLDVDRIEIEPEDIVFDVHATA